MPPQHKPSLDDGCLYKEGFCSSVYFYMKKGLIFVTWGRVNQCIIYANKLIGEYIHFGIKVCLSHVWNWNL